MAILSSDRCKPKKCRQERKKSRSGFRSTPAQTSAFGSTSQQSQPTFETDMFGASTPFCSSSPSPFGAISTPAFGASSNPAFGAISAPAFGGTSTPSFGATTPSFESTPTSVFASTGSTLGASTSSVFGTGGAFGASSTPAFGSSSIRAFGASSSPAFGTSSSPAFGILTPSFGTSSSPSFSFGSSPAFGQSASNFSSSPFASSSPFGARIGSQATTQTFGSAGFGQSTFGGQQRGGSRVTPYAVTIEQDSSGTQRAGKLESISAMVAYISKSHEELRWEDYQLGEKGFWSTPAQTSAFGSTSQQSQVAFGTDMFGASTPFGSSSPSPFGAISTPAFGSSCSPASRAIRIRHLGRNSFKSAPAFVGTSTPSFGATTPSFGSALTYVFSSTGSTLGASTSSVFGTGGAFGASSTLAFGSSSAPAFGASSSAAFGTSSSPAFGILTPSFGTSSSPCFSFGSSPAFEQSSSNFCSSSFASSSPFGAQIGSLRTKDLALHTCKICVEMKRENEMIRVNNTCFHSFCSTCVSKHVKTRITDNHRVTVPCPGLECEHSVEFESCLGIVSKDVMEAWDRAFCESLILDAHKFYCPFRDCSAMLVNDSEKVVEESECLHCHRLFCARCRVPWHAEVSCEEFWALSEDERGHEDLMLRQLVVEKKWGRCPNCKFFVERTVGCPHITCRCGYEFCYGCGSQWGQDHGGCCRD